MLARLTYCGDHIAVYTNTRSLACTPEPNIMLYVNYTLIKILNAEKKKKRMRQRLLSIYYVTGPWREWQPKPVFLPGESHGWSLASYTEHGVTKS